MSKALIVFASRSGNTQRIAELIAEGIRFGGLEAKVSSVTEIKSEADLEGYDIYLFGSATYHGEMLDSMKRLLFLAEKAGLEGKVGGAFGAWGWSGEASGRIFETMKHIFKMNMLNGVLPLKESSVEGGIKAAQDYGREAAQQAGA